MAPPFDGCNRELFTTFVAVPNDSGAKTFGFTVDGAVTPDFPREEAKLDNDFSLRSESFRTLLSLFSGAITTLEMAFATGSRLGMALLAREEGLIAARDELEVLPKGDLIFILDTKGNPLRSL